MKITSFIVLFLLIGISASYSKVAAQEIGDWQIYSSYSTINSLDVSETGTVYSATLGGLLEIQAQKVSRYNVIDGMSRLNARVVQYDRVNQQLFLGYSSGVIDVFDPVNKTFISYADIARVSQFPSRQINDLKLINNELYVATDFGIVVFDPSTYFVSNSYLQLGSIARGTNIFALDFGQDSIFAATNNGIASAHISDNLLDVESWNVTFTTTAVSSNSASQFVALGSLRLTIANDTLLMRKNGEWRIASEVIPTLPVTAVTYLDKTDSEVIISYRNRVISLDTLGNLNTLYTSSGEIIQSAQRWVNQLIIGTAQDGIALVNLVNNDIEKYLPDGPYLNFFSELEFNEGTLLASSTDQFPQTDPFNPFRGYYLFDGENWTNYNRNTNDEMQRFGYGTAYVVDISDRFYAIGSWGDGMLLQNKVSGDIEIFDRSNSGFSGISSNRNYVVIAGLDSDPDNNIWATSFISDLPLNVYDNDQDAWFHFPGVPNQGNDMYFKLFADSYGNLWISLIDLANKGRGLLVINPGNDISSNADDIYRKLNDGENSGNLPDDYVSAMVEDKNGEVWIGTQRGIARFIFPQFITQSNNPSEYRAQWLINSDTSALSRYLLRDVNVSAMAVNSANEKWVGSVNQGIWVLNNNGSAILKRFTAENSGLISNNIESITINNETGEVFISTDLGLVSYSDVPKAAVTKMGELKVFPNPFVYERHNEILIEGLGDATTIKIVGADGTIVHQFDACGGRVSWNALDSGRRQLASGVYFVVAISGNGDEKGIGKVVIIR